MSQEEKPIEVHVDLSRIEERLKSLEEMLSRKPEPVEAGKGEVLTPKESHHTRILEALKSGSLKEQWEAPLSLPEKPTSNLVAYIARSMEIRGRMGDVVNYFKGFDFTF
ncbi:MAG: hypothetical protein QW639_04635 [Candidatus Bathyarchaeia archaeon]